MKKLFLAALPAFILTGCSTDEVIDTQKTAIEFNNVFIDKSGRAANLTTDNFGNCKIWGSSSVAGAYIFNATALNITNASTVTYSPKQYWTANSTYYFMAIGSTTISATNAAWGFTAPATIPTAEGTFGTLTFDNTSAAGAVDLGYASASRVQSATIDDAAVTLNFKHALSRTRFQFTNAMGVNYKIKVSGVTVSKTPAKGTLDLSQVEPEWVNTDETTVTYILSGDQANSFDNGASVNTDRMFLLPGDTGFTVDFNIDLYTIVNGEEIHVNGSTPFHHSVSVSQTLAIGTAYLFKTTIGSENIDPDQTLKPIEFSVDVKPWDTPVDVPVEVKP